MKKQAINSLTSLRGLACLGVIIFHQKDLDPTWQDAGGMGVYFFFVLSGYLLTLRAANTILDGHTSWTFLRAYLLRRVFRIYPPFLVALALYAIFYYSGLTYLWNYPVHVTSIFGTPLSGHLWTIRYELYFYFIMFPVAFCLLSFMARQDIKKNTPYHMHLILGVIILMMIGGVFGLGIVYRGWSTRLHRYWIFLFGCIAGIASGIRKRYYSHISPSSFYIKHLCALASWVLMIRIFFISNYNAQLYLGIPRTYWTQSEIGGTVAYALLMVLLEFAEDEIWIGKALNASVLIEFGESSYSIYLMHWWVIKLFNKKTTLEGSDLQSMTVLSSIIVGQILYIIEKNCVKFGNRLIKIWKWDEKSSQKTILPPDHIPSEYKGTENEKEVAIEMPTAETEVLEVKP